jgi:hypothetical protein
VNPDDIDFPDVSVSEVLAVMDELGRAKFDAALNLARARKLAALLAAEKAGNDGN